MQTLRPYQSECVETVLAAVDPFGDAFTRVLYTQPTGCGKTTTFAELTKRLLAQDHRVLILAHRTELIGQAYERVRDHCGLHEWDIGMEIAESRANAGCKVVVGSVQTCYRPNRLPSGWEPTVIITDEGHHAAAKGSYQRIYERFGVGEGRCIHIACTATAKRTDRLCLYALGVDGQPVRLKLKSGAMRDARPDDAVFEKHVYDFSLLDAIDGGWLVPVRGHTVETETDINGVKTVGGDFVESQLAKKVDNLKRTKAAISAWKQIAADRPTLVFCASVEHAHHAADLWTQAGYTAKAVDGETDSFLRFTMFRDFKEGRLQVLCNMGIATEGVDLPNCACIVHLRPTKSWNLYMQMTGRCTRPWPGILDPLQEATAPERQQAIAASRKPDSIIIDMVDLYEKCGDLCSVPSILDLPVKLDLQGHSVTEAKKLLDEFDEQKERVIGECPTTFEELKVKLHDINLMRQSGAKTEAHWKSTDGGYRFSGMPPRYTCDLLPNHDGYVLEVKFDGRPLLSKHGKPGHDMKAYLDAAVKHAKQTIEQHRGTISRGTLSRLSQKQINCLSVNGHSRSEIDAMTYYKAKALIDKYMQAWHTRLAAQGGE